MSGSDSALLSVRGLTCRQDDGQGTAILHDFNLEVQEGEAIMLRGPSGCGKTTLLKCLAELVVYQEGEVKLGGKTASEYGYPKYRTLVQYIPQRPSMLPGTPLDLLARIKSFSSRKQPSNRTTDDSYGSTRDELDPLDPLEIASDWGIERTMWAREWGTLSGGEAQRIALAVAVGVGGAEVLLLDEPTSALDEESSLKVEKTLLSLLPPLKSQPSKTNGVQRRTSGRGPKAFIWITHAAAQAERCGTRDLDMSR